MRGNVATDEYNYFVRFCLKFKDEVEFWSCNCIVKETVWNRPEKFDHLAYKNLCVLQGSGIIKNDKKFGQVLVKLQTLYTERCIWDYTNTWRKKSYPNFYDVTWHV